MISADTKMCFFGSVIGGAIVATLLFACFMEGQTESELWDFFSELRLS